MTSELVRVATSEGPSALLEVGGRRLLTGRTERRL
jgi:hypothetical protein